MADGTIIHSRLESKSSIERFNKLENYVARLMKKAERYDDSVFINLTKQQLVDPSFTKAISQNLFAQSANGKKVSFSCIDKDLFFTEKEALTLLQNYEQIQRHGGNLFFGETMYESSLNWHNTDNGELTSLELGSKQSYRMVSFWEVMGINAKLLWVSKKINEFSTKHNLSPYENI